MALEAFFLKSPGGGRFCLFHPPEPAAPARGAVLYIHPFAEEMNRARRMAALQSRALADAGYGVLQVDLLGCGDSAGEFGEAIWAAWLADVQAACAWLQERVPGPLWLWGLRAGCLVARRAACHLGRPVDFLFWQPMVSGRLFLHQFLRLRLAGEWLGGSGSGRPDDGRRVLAEEGSVEVAGYRLGADLAQGLEQAVLDPPEQPCRLVWLEVAAGPAGEPAPSSRQCLEAWRAAGHRVQEEVVAGPPFWQTAEITESSDLIQATLKAMEQP